MTEFVQYRVFDVIALENGRRGEKEKISYLFAFEIRSSGAAQIGESFELELRNHGGRFACAKFCSSVAHAR